MKAYSITQKVLFIKSEKKLQETITTYQDHESYDGKKYPLGLFTKEHYESEANFATELLNQLEKINIK